MVDVERIIAFEEGTLDDEGVIELFQDLIDDGTVWSLQGSYGRMAKHLIDAGFCVAPEILEEPR